MIVVLTDYNAMRAAILTWLTTYAGLSDAVFKNQAAPRPAKPYAGILITSDGTKIGIDERRPSFDAGNNVIQLNTTGPRKMNVQVDIYSDPAKSTSDIEAADYLNTALLMLDTLAIEELFKSANLALLNHTSINRLDEQLGNRWERRAQVDLTFLYTGETFDDGSGSSGDWIETVEIPTMINGNLTLHE